MRAANDNKPLPSLEEFMRLRALLFQNIKLRPPNSHKHNDHLTAEQSLQNFIWFFKFELACREVEITQKRKDLKVVT